MQILAWNGGGSSNYSSIIEKGSYTKGAKVAKIAQIADKIEKLTSEIEDVVEEKIRHFVTDL